MLGHTRIGVKAPGGLNTGRRSFGLHHPFLETKLCHLVSITSSKTTSKENRKKNNSIIHNTHLHLLFADHFQVSDPCLAKAPCPPSTSARGFVCVQCVVLLTRLSSQCSYSVAKSPSLLDELLKSKGDLGFNVCVTSWSVHE